MTHEERRRLLAALSETILPADEGPGAIEAGVLEYLERALDRRAARDRVKIESGLDLVDSMARQRQGKVFADCGHEERADVLMELQRVPHRIVRVFFSKIVGLAIEGFLCHPSHGGNRGGAGWRAVGYPGEPSQ
ncbi:MAG TPA: gluconate 2-dehydrogenase subunit 3 family protein [Thermoanaerobaculia bacterium]|nr:gluconate 2-dehydrogenase subunit 3 family protein [Thermoanaerobaculia bacterium]